MKAKPAPQPDATERVPIGSLKPDPHNARERTPRNQGTNTAALSRFGQQKPIVVDSDDVIRAGNGTWLAAKELGWADIWIARTALTGKEAAAYGIADNRASDLSQFNEDALIATLAEIGDDLAEIAGFDAAELDELVPHLALDDEPNKRDPRAAIRDSMKNRILVRVMLAMQSVAQLERALRLTGFQNREQAMMEIAREYLSAKGQLDLSSEAGASA